MDDLSLSESQCGGGVLYSPSFEGQIRLPILLLCHGVGGHHGNLSLLARSLHLEGIVRVRMVDLPGHGRSSTQLLELRQIDEALAVALTRCASEAELVFALTVSAGAWFFSRLPRRSLSGLFLVNPITLADLRQPKGPPSDEVDVRRQLLSRFFSASAVARMDADPVGRPRLRVGVARELIRRSGTRIQATDNIITILTRNDPLRSLHVSVSQETVYLDGDSHGLSDADIVAQVKDTVRRKLDDQHPHSTS